MIKAILTFCIIIFSACAGFSQSYSNPESAVWNAGDNCWYISNADAGQIIKRDASGNLSIFKSGISPNPYGIDIIGNTIFACCGSSIYGYDLSSATQVFNINTGASFLNGICHNSAGFIFASDFSGKKIYRVSTEGNTYNIMAQGLVQSPNGLLLEPENNRILIVNWGNNAPIKALSLSDSTVTVVSNTTYSNLDGITKDNAGNYYVSSWGASGILKFSSDFQSSELIFSGISQPADIDYSPITDTLAVPATGNDDVYFYDLNSEIIEPCDDLPFNILSNNILFYNSEFITEADSMLVIPIVNNSAYNYAYPLMQIQIVNSLPNGMNFLYSPEQFEVFASAWNTGDTAYAQFPFVVDEQIPENFMLQFNIRVTNLDPAPVDTCYFQNVYEVNLNPDQITQIPTILKKPVLVYPNPSSGTFYLSNNVDIESLSIYSMQGKEVFQMVHPSNKVVLKTNPGIYFGSV